MGENHKLLTWFHGEVLESWKSSWSARQKREQQPPEGRATAWWEVSNPETLFKHTEMPDFPINVHQPHEVFSQSCPKRKKYVWALWDCKNTILLTSVSAQNNPSKSSCCWGTRFGLAVEGVGGNGAPRSPFDGARVPLPPPALPKINTKSSKGLVDVPANKPAAAGVCAKTCVAANPDGCPSVPVESSKSLRSDYQKSKTTE